MRTKTIVAISIAGFGFALWLARGGDPPQSPTAIAPPPATAVVTPLLPRAARLAPSATRPPAAKPVVRKLDPKSERYANRMDDQIPTHLYSLAAHCYKGGLQRDQRIDLTYHIRVADGVITLSDVQVTDSTVNDPALQSCVTSTVANASWRDDELPDVQEEGELYMRAAGWAAYLANDDADDSGGDAMN